MLTATVIIAHSPLQAGANHLHPGFSFPESPKPLIFVLHPQIDMNSQGNNGEPVPNGEWQAKAVENLKSALNASELSSIADLEFMAAPTKGANPAYEDFLAVVWQLQNEIIFAVPQGTNPVQSGKKGRYIYRVDPELTARLKAQSSKGRFGLFVRSYDTYATTGQILGEIAGATAGGVFTPKGQAPPMRRTRLHATNSLLFDLLTGDVLWFHGDGAIGGDLRRPDSALTRVKQALTKFPGLPKR